jgi:hypothetical protein
MKLFSSNQIMILHQYHEHHHHQMKILLFHRMKEIHQLQMVKIETPGSRLKKCHQSTSKPKPSLDLIPSTSTSASATLSSLSKLLLLNGTPIQSPFNPTKSSLVSIQPKPTPGSDIYHVNITTNKSFHFIKFLCLVM